MPEGDTLFRTAAALRPVICEQTIVAAAGRHWSVDATSLVGRRCASVEARGKHLLIHLDDNRTIHSHLGMTGSWHIYRPGEAWRKPARLAALLLELGAAVVVCFSPKTLELLTANQLRAHRFLQNLGPDLLDPNFDIQQAMVRYRTCGQVPIGEAVMNQAIACGIGNIYKSEVLFVEKTSPFARVEQLSDARLRGILEQARRLMQRNLGGQPRRTRFGRDGSRLWVYGRAGETCYRCGDTIQVRRQGELGRSTFWCPTCQG